MLTLLAELAPRSSAMTLASAGGSLGARTYHYGVHARSLSVLRGAAGGGGSCHSCEVGARQIHGHATAARRQQRHDLRTWPTDAAVLRRTRESRGAATVLGAVPGRRGLSAGNSKLDLPKAAARRAEVESPETVLVPPDQSSPPGEPRGEVGGGNGDGDGDDLRGRYPKELWLPTAGMMATVVGGGGASSTPA